MLARRLISKAPKPVIKSRLFSLQSRVIPRDAIPGPGTPGMEYLLEHANGGSALYYGYNKLYEEFGPVVRFDWPDAPNVVVLFHPQDMTDIHRSVKFPSSFQRNGFWLTREYSEMRRGTHVSLERSLVSLEGKEWQKVRHLAQKNIFNRAVVDEYSTFVGPAALACAEEVGNLTTERDTLDGPALLALLQRYTFEAIFTVLFGYSPRAIANGGAGAEDRMRQFIEENLSCFAAMGNLIRSPKGTKERHENSGDWRKFVRTMDAMSQISSDLVHELIECVENGEKHWEKYGAEPYLVRQLALLGEGKLEFNDVLQLVRIFMFAGIDTTSNAILWLVTNLSRFPDTQEKLRAELNDVMGKGEYFSAKHLSNTPYLKAMEYESHRLTPTANLSVRTLDSDIELMSHADGNTYLLPEGTTVQFSSSGLAKDPAYFSDPEEFIPERWLEPMDRGVQGSVLMKTPFGWGPRMCLGSRLAQMEVRAVVAELVRNYRLTIADDAYAPKIAAKLVNYPSPYPNVRLERVH